MKLYKIFRRPPSFISVSTWIKKEDQTIKSGPDARLPIIVPILEMQYGTITEKLKMIGPLFDMFKSIMINMRKSAKSIIFNPKLGKRQITEEHLKELKNKANELGISTIGFTKVNANHIFKDFEILYDNAIILTMEMNKGLMAKGPGQENMNEIMRTYDGLGIAVNEIADFLREKGYNCHASPAFGGDINTVPAAQDAGLGFVGNNGILISPEYGPCMRLAAVFVDIENLPFPENNEHGWIADFCNSCNKCIKKCPAQAIYKTPHYNENGGRVYIDPVKCAEPFSRGCSLCVSSCVFTGGHYDKIKRGYEMKMSKVDEISTGTEEKG
ncbi:4Fe-4S dicluster domain-containing protein [Flammeovirga aprica]|uniref:[Fe-S]-binding protein n=1 Tax=Flammeovirga aprica JL-4 TaxID=694437 RepID=A0A7X9S209_9BACT|nr:4Fe-4S dicluster domain-containing protein [Flammeovirga aprica]NME72917.1 [Fe-S]-binding protein [Flammeovirga aprica JL-4]